ncbi:MAG: GMC oxidoreductase [Gemmatimonadales bacterium]
MRRFPSFDSARERPGGAVRHRGARRRVGRAGRAAHRRPRGSARSRPPPAGALVARLDGRGESHEVGALYVADGSAFPTSSGVNPMITIMAIADHVARGMVESR